MSAKTSNRSNNNNRFRSLRREELRVSITSKKRSVLTRIRGLRCLSRRCSSTGIPRPARADSRKAWVKRKGMPEVSEWAVAR